MTALSNAPRTEISSTMTTSNLDFGTSGYVSKILLAFCSERTEVTTEYLWLCKSLRDTRTDKLDGEEVGKILPLSNEFFENLRCNVAAPTSEENSRHFRAIFFLERNEK